MTGGHIHMKKLGMIGAKISVHQTEAQYWEAMIDPDADLPRDASGKTLPEQMVEYHQDCIAQWEKIQQFDQERKKSQNDSH